MGLYEEVATFRKYDKVVVTGPQRAGTHIASEIIADILGWPVVEESELDSNRVAIKDSMPNSSRRRKRIRLEKDYSQNYFKWAENSETNKMVLQCPRVSHRCHQTIKGTLVVFMMRDVDEIIASDKHRIAKYKQGPWAGPHRWGTPVPSVFNEKARQYSRQFFKGKPLLDTWDTPAAVYDVWQNKQKEFDFDYYELDYNLLKEHRMWLPLEVRREKFTSGTQTCLKGDESG
jgi:hypothetical protein